LRGRADRVERAEVRSAIVITVATRHSAPDFLADGERFAREHGRLFRDAYAAKVQIRVEALRRSTREPRDELLARAVPFDVRAHELRVTHVAYDEILPARISFDL